MRTIKRLASLTLITVLTAVLLSGLADFGDFSGSSDYGGWSSGGSDWSSSFDWNYSGSGNGEFSLSSLIVYILLMILWMLIRYYVKHGTIRSTGAGNARPSWGFQLRDIRDCPVPLPDNTHLEELYRRMQDAWGQADLTPLQGDLAPDCLAQYSRQLKAKAARGETAHCIVHSVSAAIRGFNESEYEFMLAAEIEAVITAWNTDSGGRTVSGSSSARKRMRYAWVLRRSREETDGIQICPNCGSPVEINEGAYCPNCGAKLTASGNSWALASIQGISQQTIG